jgi:hypothetical protein
MNAARTATARGRALAGLWAAALVSLAGCVNQPVGGGARAVENDPLTGGPPIPPAPAAAATAGAKAAAPAQPSAPGSTGSTAALAVGQPKDKTAEKQPDPRTTAAPDGWRAPASSATLNEPKPAEGTETAPSVAVHPPMMEAAPPAAAGVPPIDSYQQAQQLLDAYGATDRLLKEVSERSDWYFECRVPTGPGQAKVFNGTLPGENGLAVIRAVLQRMEMDLGPATGRKN